MLNLSKWFTFILLLTASPLAAYQVCFEGVASTEIREVIASVSKLNSDQARPPPTFFTLKKRAESDKKALIEVMHAFGYYDAEVSLIYWGKFPDITIRVEIETGAQYFFESLVIKDENGLPLLIDSDEFNIKIGSPVRADVILDTQEQILEELGSCGHPHASIVDRIVTADQESKTVFVEFIVAPGPLAYFGPVSIQGLRRVRHRYIRRRIAWETGALYQPGLIDATNDYIQESGLFSYVMVRPAEEMDENGLLPICIQLEEKKFRHIGAGVSYSTDESAGAMFQWRHDNFSGWGDACALVGEYSEVIKRATALYAMPDFYGRRNDLLFSAELRREDAPGFIEREASLLIRIERRVNDLFSFNYGARYERLLSTKSDNDTHYNLLSLPVQVRWDTSNRLLNPTCGTTLTYFGTPYKAICNSSIFFFKQEFFAATYQPITRSGNILLALSAQFGSIEGESLFMVPAPKRFYAGSSTSLRGYKYLTVSPLSEKKPIGGRSLMIFMIEPRIRILDKLYFATFYDFGNVYSTPFPRLNEKLLRSFGCGIRYLTPVGPFRLDIGFPIDKRKGIDKSFQIYASIGQSF